MTPHDLVLRGNDDGQWQATAEPTMKAPVEIEGCGKRHPGPVEKVLHLGARGLGRHESLSGVDQNDVDREALGLSSGRQAADGRQRESTWRAPSRPELENGDATDKAIQCERPPIETQQTDLVQRLSGAIRRSTDQLGEMLYPLDGTGTVRPG